MSNTIDYFYTVNFRIRLLDWIFIFKQSQKTNKSTQTYAFLSEIFVNQLFYKRVSIK